MSDLETKIEYLTDIENLRVFEIIDEFSHTPSIPHFDFTTIGLTAETPKYGLKGVKKYCSYSLNGLECVRKTFSYKSDGLWLVFEWFALDGEVGLRKVEFKPLDSVEIAKIEKANRDRSITYLQAKAKGTPIESHVNEVLKHYYKVIQLFIQNNTPDFINALNSETDPTIIAYMDIIVEAPSENYPTGKRVKDAILEQIL